MKKILAVILTIAVVFTLTACGSGGGATGGSGGQASSNTSGGSGGSDNKTIVVLLKNLTNPFWVDVKKGAEKAGADFGYNVKVVAPVIADNNEEQIQLLEQELLNPPAAFVIAPADSMGIAPAVEQINQLKIPVINLNTRITAEGLDIVTFVATDNIEVGKVTMEALAEKMGGKGNVVIITGVPGQQNSIDRRDGALQAIENYPDITVVDEQIANWNREESMKVTQDLLQKHAQIDGIFAVNGEMAIGSSEAVRQAGKTGQVKIAGIDVFEEVINRIKNGDVTITNDGVSQTQGYNAVKAAIDVIEGKQVDPRIRIPTKIVDESNAGEYTFS